MHKFSTFAAGLALAIAGLTAATAQDAAPVAPGARDASRVVAGSYKADAAHTLVGWRVSHLGFNDYFGIFGDISGTLQIDPAAIEATKVDVTIPVAGVTVANAALRDHLLRPGADGKAPDFFGPSPAPARFQSTSVRADGANRAIMSGILTLNGESKPVTLLVEFAGAGNGPMDQVLNIGFHARGTIKRSEFGIGFGVPFVSDEVDLDITAAFENTGA